ncbi:uncharacterized protein LOC143040868 [Oratosquilla oratoria]|uniref:uncharacterized protein LOC143040868 n=1 Tax=Oratosquilla oratoria TaxID=337810 RepID=UPI003F7780EF
MTLRIQRCQYRRGHTVVSLDVESLFTNIDVDRTINYILQEVFPEGETSKLKIPKNLFRQLLEICTKEAPFYCPRGQLYKQIDGVAMGSPLGVLFANFFMGMAEREVFSTTRKPPIYTRYVDNILVLNGKQNELWAFTQYKRDTSLPSRVVNVGNMSGYHQ